MPHRSLPPHRDPQPGFSLVELLVTAVVMVLSTIGSTTVFNLATRQGLQSNSHLQDQFAISDDLAHILEINERYSCAAGLCAATLPPPVEGVLPPPPDQDHYAPADIDASADPGGRSFRQLCSQGLLTNLIAAIGTNSLTPTGVRRTVAVIDASGAATDGDSVPPHRYRVDWRDSHGKLLRQVQLIPTVAAWCP